MIYELLLMLYVLGTLFGLWLLFKKAGLAPWKAFVPFWNIWLWVRLCGKKWPWFLAFLVPGINIFIFLLTIVETARVMRRTNFWEQTFGVLLPCVYLPIVGLRGGIVYHDPRTDPPAKVSETRDWSEAILFALIAAVLIRAFSFELFSIPSSSMEKSLLVGDHLLVSKMAYGPRVIQTPLALPLMHNLIVGTNIKSYLDWPHLPYHRFPGYTHVKRYDAVVFNFPAGDTILKAFPGGQVTYYDAVRACGRQAVLDGTALYEGMPLGGIDVRPVDKREHYIKRCIGLPGETLQIIDQQLFINGSPLPFPEETQFMHMVVFAAGVNPMGHLDECGVSREDIERSSPHNDAYGNTVLFVPLSDAIVRSLQSRASVLEVQRQIYPADSSLALFPNDPRFPWSVDNYGPIHIPAKGELLQLSLDNLPLYRRLITAYEGNSLEVRNGKIIINGNETTSYRIKQDYYWMMGDNRHCSQDSRFWGFVPEDHIAGKAKCVLFSSDKDHGGLRKGRFFKSIR